MREFRSCSSGRSCCHSQWRYRLGVRTEDSQSSNPGSIPGSATNYIRQSPLIQRVLFLPKKLVALFARKKRSPWYTKWYTEISTRKRQVFRFRKAPYFWLKAESQKSQPLAPSPRFRNSTRSHFRHRRG